MKGERDIFCAALDRTSEMSRETFLSQACAESPATRARVEALLRAADAAGDFLADDSVALAESAGMRIDRYQLVERLGEGGFGVVYRAEQEHPVRRSVALKIIKAGMDTRAVVARFEAERQALAIMDHPNIARVFDGGATTTGRPYFVMELVSGTPITTFCNQQHLAVRERLELFLQVCGAVHHAHQKGVIHRDLKPSNILVAALEGKPVAKVIDFGIAKATREPLTERTLLTQHHMFVGTPAYMSPEQIAPGNMDVDTRTDIYGLGALLYELLAGRPVIEVGPLLARGYAEVQRTIREIEPEPPSRRVANLDARARLAAAAQRSCAPDRLASELRGDLDRIVLKCLEKDRTRRYETTEALARDISRHLQHEPVHARRPTLAYRTSKFVRRHRAGVSASAAAVVLLAGITFFHTERLAAERDRARAEARKAAKVSELLTEVLITGDPFRTPSPQDTLAASAARVRQEFAAEPDVRAEVLNAVGRVHLRRGDHAKALPILTEALQAGRAIGRPDLRLAQTLSDLGILHRETGDTAGAIPLLEEALALRRTLRGNEHNDVGISLVELGRAQIVLERLDRAEPLFREALEIRRRVLGVPHREVAVSLGDLGVLLWRKGELADAERYILESIAMHCATVGAEHPNVGQSLANLAQLKIDQKELNAAERLLQNALAIARQSFPEGHWRTARTRGELAGVYRRQQRLTEAAEMLDDALRVARDSLGGDKPQVVALMIERARVHLDGGQAAAAEPLLREALRQQRQTFADSSWRVASTKSLLGAVLTKLGRLAEAETLLLEASEHLRDVPGLHGRETQPTRARLAALREAALTVRR